MATLCFSCLKAGKPFPDPAQYLVEGTMRCPTHARLVFDPVTQAKPGEQQAKHVTPEDQCKGCFFRRRTAGAVCLDCAWCRICGREGADLLYDFNPVLRVVACNACVGATAFPETNLKK